MEIWSHSWPPPQGRMAPDEEVVQGRGRLCAAIRSNKPQMDHGGAHRAISPSTTPGREDYHIYRAFTSGGLGTYRGQDIVGGSEVEDQPLWRSLWDEGGTPPDVVKGGSGGGGGGGIRVRNGGRDGGRDSNRAGDGDRGGGDEGRRDDVDDGDGNVTLAEGGGAGAGGLPGGSSVIGCHMESSGNDPQGGRGLLKNRPSGGGVEGGDSDYQSLLHSLHRLP